MTNVSFGSSGTTLAIAHALADKRKQQEHQSYTCPLTHLNRKINATIVGAFIPAQKPVPPIQPKYAALTRFKGDNDSNSGDDSGRI